MFGGDANKNKRQPSIVQHVPADTAVLTDTGNTGFKKTQEEALCYNVKQILKSRKDREREVIGTREIPEPTKTCRVIRNCFKIDLQNGLLLPPRNLITKFITVTVIISVPAAGGCCSICSR